MAVLSVQNEVIALRANIDRRLLAEQDEGEAGSILEGVLMIHVHCDTSRWSIKPSSCSSRRTPQVACHT
jgi:hypothetical protein